MSETTANFLFSMSYLVVLSFIIIYAAWRVFCRPDCVATEHMTQLKGVTKIHYQDDNFAQVFFRDGTTRLIARKHLVLKDHDGQMFCVAHSLVRCELIVTADGTEMRGLIVEVPEGMYEEPGPFMEAR